MMTPVERGLCIWILCIGAMSLLGLRLYVHHGRGFSGNKYLWASDALLVFVMLVFIGVGISMEIKLAILREHPEKVTTTPILAFGPAQGICYVIMLWVTKISFLLFYLSLQRYLTPSFRIVLGISAFFTVGTFVMNLLFQFIWCRPFKSMITYGAGYCSANVDTLPATMLAATNIASDIVVMLTGLVLIKNLQLGSRQKIGLAFIVIIGIIPVIASSVRFSNIRTIITEKNQDIVRRSLFNVELWSQLDAATAIYATCLPALRTFIRRREPKGTYQGSASHGSGTGRNTRPTPTASKQLASLWSTKSVSQGEGSDTSERPIAMEPWTHEGWNTSSTKLSQSGAITGSA